MKDQTKVMDEVIKMKMAVMDKVLEDLVEPMAAVGNPERLIGKPYFMWTPQDKTLLAQIYGNGDKTPLAKLIFNKEYERVMALEAEVGI